MTMTELFLCSTLHRALGERTGKLRVSDAYLICGIEPGKINRSKLSSFDRAIRMLGWERQRRRFDGGSIHHAYVKGSATEREVECSVGERASRPIFPLTR
jgi:hypothetical protein